MSSPARTVTLDELVFTMSWEDPALDRAAFGLSPGADVAIVTSGGCNALTLLLDDPRAVLAFDYNPTQGFVLELKAAAFRRLDYDGLLELLGVRNSRRRAALVDAALTVVSPEARAYWAVQPWLVRDGLLNGGRYERFLGHFRRLLRLIQGRRGTEALFEPRDARSRERFYDEEWDRLPWRLLFRLFFNKRILARRGLSASYFRFDDGSRSFAESFYRRASHAFRDLSVHDNYFLAQYVLGRYRAGFLPEHLRPESFEVIRSRVDRLEIVSADVRTVFDQRAAAFDAICLSNVFELMPADETAAVLRRVATALRPGGRLTLRNLMIPRAVEPDFFAVLCPDAARARELHAQDRSIVYGSLQVYTRQPDRAASGPGGSAHAIVRAQPSALR
jgi:S-adenosylmethionine-diacylglycerol 3-amino-3-carboxypropyl transferase